MTEADFEKLIQNTAENFGDSYIDTSLLSYEPHEFSARFERKMRKLIKKQKRFYFPLVKTPLRMAFTIIAMVIIMTMTTVMSVGAFREAFIGFFINTFSDHSDLKGVDDDQHPETIEDTYDISYDLSGYYVDFKSDYEHGHILKYKNKDTKSIIRLEQYTNSSLNLAINTEDAEITHTDLNGFDAMYYLDNHNYSNYVWDNGEYTIIISSNLSKEETFEIAKSVRKSE